MPALLSLLSGVLFALALPPANREWLDWVALAPLLYAARGRRPLEAVGLGLLTGGAAGAVIARWHSDTDSLLLGWLPFLCLAAFFGAAAWAGEAARARGWAGIKWIVFVACVGVGAEWLTTFSPLPLNIAVCQGRTLPVIQIASISGIWGVSFLLWLTNAALADALLARRVRLVPLLTALGMIALSLSTGYWEQTQARAHTASLAPLRLAAIQDFSPAEAGRVAPAAALDADIPDREALSRQAAARGAQMIVWSEDCLGTGYRPQKPDDETNTLARTLGTCLVVGYADNALPLPFNCAGLISPQGRALGVYHKMHLFMGERQTNGAGQGTPAFPAALARVGMEVCFDSLYSGTTRGLARAGAQVIAMPNFDPPTPYGVLHLLHAAQLPFRAVENRVPFVRADSNGASQVIAADGRIVAQGPLWAPGVVAGSVLPGDGRGTFFTRFGDRFAYGCVAGALLLGLGVRASRALVPAAASWEQAAGA